MDRVRKLGIDDEGRRVYQCPVCHSGKVRIADNVFYGRCDTCKATVIDYQPLNYQEAFHVSNAQYRLAIGGYGTGKTTEACAETATHVLSIKNARVLITAPTLSLVKDAVIPELEKFIPPWFIEKSRKNPAPYYKLINGSEIIVYSAADQQKLRSLNLTGFYIEEASGVDYAIFDQLTARLRNKAAVMKDAEGNEIGYKFMGILSTNPEDGWIRDNFLLISSKIVASDSIDPAIYDDLKGGVLQKHYHSFISSTRDNPHIPGDFIERMCAGKSASWVRKYVDCYLDVREGAVYPNFNKNIVEPFRIPHHWLRVAGYDPGFADPTAFLIGAIDPKDGVVYFYDEHYVTHQPVSYHASIIKGKVGKFKFAYPIQADPSVRKRNERDGKSHADYFFNISGITLQPGINNIEYGVDKVRDYLHAGKFKFFNTLVNTKKEGSNYKFESSKNGKNVNDKPVDKDNHLMDTLRYIAAILPRNPHDLAEVYIQSQQEVISAKVFVEMGNVISDSKDDEWWGEEQTVIGGLKI